MDPSLRSQLRDSLKARSDAEGWRALIAQHGTPLLVLDPYRVVERCRLLKSHLRGFGLHYAVKTLPHPAVLRAVAASGCGFDVTARAELDLLGKLGLPIDRCINTNPIKKLTDIDRAYLAGVRTFVVDNPLEAQKFAGLPADINILVRLAFPNPSAKSGLSVKFGVDPADAELVVKHVLATGVRFAGFSFHVDGRGTKPESYGSALRGTLDLVTHIAETLGVTTDVIEIGGGLPVSLRDPRSTIDKISDIVDETLGDRRDEFTLLADPGRFLAADAMTLLTGVAGSAVRGGRLWHYLDDGIDDVHPPILSLREILEGPIDCEPVVLAGPTCDGADVFACDYPMPTLGVGDVVVSPMMGAYPAVASTQFNVVSATKIVEV
ncbi:type III PLP-dependent enzyme domain-containing protein [Mycolicibacterium stellerae]|uniref:type III PLP-dependent enzyme n=1 Tax=Mycolicibacterium stellerae TaxID=2358193 RepID=UPI000F0BC472|nr:type III PLP-dependent enzyme [Mycolicibacterium stellerae]